MKVHLFGAASSPGCVNYGLKYLATENNQSHHVRSQFIAKDCYVFDVVKSTDAVEKAIQLAQEAREICSKGGLHLHKFVSNSNVTKCYKASRDDTRSKDLTFEIRFSNTLKDQPATHRDIWSTVPSTYAPLGFFTPYILTWKRILQEMCNQGTGWDDPCQRVSSKGRRAGDKTLSI